MKKTNQVAAPKKAEKKATTKKVETKAKAIKKPATKKTVIAVKNDEVNNDDALESLAAFRSAVKPVAELPAATTETTVTETAPIETAPSPAPETPVSIVITNGKDVKAEAQNITNKSADGIFRQEDLRNDNIYVESKIVPLKELTGMPATSKFSHAIVSEGKIVNVVSDRYGFVPNEKFFYEVEANLLGSDINYVTRSINRSDAHFAVDYILADERFHIDIKGGGDLVTPMLRFTNSYGGSPTSGSFGFFRKVCSNGLHIAQSKVGFKMRHKSNVNELVLPEIKGVIEKFMDNEFYQLKRKFEVMAETPIKDLEEFVKFTCTKLDLFKYEKSEKNPEPSAKAQFVIDLVKTEANKVSAQEINTWLGYNAFNQVIHDKMNRSFLEQKNLDTQLFNTVMEFSN